MNILQVTPRYPPQSGGVETHVKEISERLVEYGHRVTVVAADAGGKGNRRETRNGVRVRRYRSLAPDDAMHVCPQITKAVRDSDADVVHAHNYHSFPLFFAALGVGDRRFVVTTHYHGGSASSFRDRLLVVYRPFGRWAIRRADQVVAVSGWEKDQLASDFSVEATVIPNGVETERFSTAKPFEWERRYLLTVGRLEEYKGVQHVIRTMSDLPEYDLLVAGSGPYREELERVARAEGVEERVEFLGYVDDEVLPELYAGAEVYVTLSEFESYGITVAEALAAGTPCVVQPKRALTDWSMKKSVTSVDEVRAKSLCRAVNNAIESGMFTENIVSWENVAKECLVVYQSSNDSNSFDTISG